MKGDTVTRDERLSKVYQLLDEMVSEIEGIGEGPDSAVQAGRILERIYQLAQEARALVSMNLWDSTPENSEGR